MTAGDGAVLHFVDREPIGPLAGGGGTERPVVLVHGWSFSGRWFGPLTERLVTGSRVVVPDLRGHGETPDPGGGHTVGRLSEDLHELLEHLDLQETVLVGWSLGAAVAWGLLERFGDARVAGLVCIDQTPRQYRAVDWDHPHARLVDEAALASFLDQLRADPAAMDRDTLSHALARPVDEEVAAGLLAELGKASVTARAEIMTDHTRRDWREFVTRLPVPVLSLVAADGPVQDPGGPAWVGERAPRGRSVLYEGTGHALFRDRPDDVMSELTAFRLDPAAAVAA